MKPEHEVVCAVGSIAKLNRKIVVFVLYIPPNIKTSELATLSEALMQEIAAVRAAIRDPVIYVGSDFNRRDLGPDLELAGDLALIPTGLTRGDGTLDLIYTNAANATVETLVLPPLDDNRGGASDHKRVFLASKLGRERRFKWVVKMRRTRNLAREEAFASEMAGLGWDELGDCDSVEEMVDRLEKVTAALTEKHFPLVRVRKRSNEDPWITRSIRRLWKKKVRIYKKYGKSAAWWETDRILQDEINESKEAFVDRLLADGGNGRTFYSATRKLAASTAEPPWSVTDLYVGMGPEQVGKEILQFYGRLAESELPPDSTARPRVPAGLGVFSVERTSKLLKESKKTESRVVGDPFLI